MKEEESLLSKEGLASIKESRNSNIISGAAQITGGLVIASLLVYNGDLLAAVGILVFFTAIGVVSFVIAFKHGRDYRDKLKKLKKGINGRRRIVII